MIKKIIISVVFIIGLSIFAYPIVSNYMNNREHVNVISTYNEEVAKLTEAQKEKKREEARDYNEKVKASEFPIEDPFSDDVLNNTDDNDGYYSVLDIGDAIGSIEIPEINVDLPIYHGVGKDVLQKGVGHMSNSSFPIGGKGTHTALTGHRGLPTAKLFRNLDKMKMDDIFFVHTLDETLAYKVDDIKIVKPQETNWLTMAEDHDYVTLITCDPYMINTDRLLVRGERTPYNPEQKPAPPFVPADNDGGHLWLAIVIISLLTAILIYMVYKKRKHHHAVSNGGI